MLAFPTLLLTACASNAPVKPEPVEINVPVYVALPAELTAQVPEPMLPSGPVTNADLAEWADALKAALQTANRRLRMIEGLQPVAK